MPGDVYQVFDNGNLTPILTTTFNGAQTSILPIGDPNGDAGWTSASYTHGQVLLGPGPHSLVVQEPSGFPPAGFYDRIDPAPPVPEPTTLALFSAIALGSAGYYGWRRRKQAVTA